MVDLIVVFPKIDDAKSIRNLLNKYGFHVAAVCNTGASAIAAADAMEDGIIVSGYRFPDMLYSEIRENIPENFQLLLVASQKYWEDCDSKGIVTVAMPLKVHELVATLQMMAGDLARQRKRRKAKPKERSDEQRTMIAAAKELLMARNNMTEEEAHHYIQKCSMDSGTNMVETAQMILSLMGS